MLNWQFWKDKNYNPLPLPGKKKMFECIFVWFLWSAMKKSVLPVCGSSKLHRWEMQHLSVKIYYLWCWFDHFCGLRATPRLWSIVSTLKGIQFSMGKHIRSILMSFAQNRYSNVKRLFKSTFWSSWYHRLKWWCYILVQGVWSRTESSPHSITIQKASSLFLLRKCKKIHTTDATK